MKSELSDEFILNSLFTYANNPTYNRVDDTYVAGCPICREGKSWGKKKRMYYYPKTKSFYCFNCSESYSARNWIHKVSGMSYEEIDSQRSDGFSLDVTSEIFGKPAKERKQLPVPSDSINLTDHNQIKFYIGKNKWVKTAVQYMKERRLLSAINRPRSFYMSLSDFVHRNRLVIPFFGVNSKIDFYQTRALDGSLPKYLGKMGSDKTIFGIDRIDQDFEYIFIFEGPIDSMFVKNGVAVCGLTMTKRQEEQLAQFPFHKKIWVLDNISKTQDKETRNKVLKLLNQSKKLYKWKDSCKYKDFNEWAVKEGLDEIPYTEILSSLF